MKQFRNISIIASAIAVCSMGFTSCDDDDEYDFPGDANNVVYIPDNSGSYGIIQTPVGTFGGVNCGFIAKARSSAAGDIKIGIEVDNSLIDAYNEQNGTEFLAVPAEAVSLSQDVVTIPAGAFESVDTAFVSISEEYLPNLTDRKGYIIPVRMSSVNGGSARPAQSVNSISYLTVGISEKIVNDDATEGNCIGSLVSDRSAWTVTGIDGTEVGTKYDYSTWEQVPCDPAAWFDGDAGNSAVFEGSGDVATVVVDMGRVYNGAGIKACYQNWGYDYGTFADGTQLYFSTDNSNWNDIGTLQVSDWSGKSFVGLYGAVPMRYIKLVVPNTSGWGNPEIECGDFNVYAK